MKYKLSKTVIYISLIGSILTSYKTKYDASSKIPSKTFKIGKHHLCIHMPTKNADSKDIITYQFDVPGGY